jgi:DNA polymerase-3 subunit gamma/tau
MASQSLYRKWRSQTFGDLVGQEPVIRTLKNALNSGSLAHAYLFTGPRGTGKTSTARLLAKTINCLHPKDGEPCNDCEQCHEITVGSSFNVIEIDAASNRGIDSIRELREKVMVPPTNGKYKVYILDEAHMLTTEAFNALLKTLEEPPPHAIFVMATTDVHKMLPTVLSRCQRFDFKRFSTRQLVDRLRFVAEQEQVTLEAGAAELIARAAAGGMRDALSLLDQAIAYSGNEILLNQVQVMLGVADPRAIQKFVGHIANLDSPAGLHLIHELSESGADLRQINLQVAEYCRAMMLTRAGASIAEILDLTEDEMSEIVQMAQLFSLEELTEYARIFAQNDLVQKNQGTPQLGLELALLACIELHHRGQSGQSVSPTTSAPMARPSQAPTQGHVRPSGTNGTPVSARPYGPAPTEFRSSPVSISMENTPAPKPDAKPVEVVAPLPDWDDVPLPDEPNEEYVPEPSSRPQIQATPAVNAVPEESILVVSQPQPVQATPSPDADTGTATAPMLTIEEVRECWEYIKRRVKSKKDGAKIAALLNGYAIVGVEGTQALPVVVIRANADFYYSTLQQNTSHHATVEWAMKIELKQECKLRLLPPGHSLATLGSIPPPTPRDSETSLSTSTIARTPQRSPYREQSISVPQIPQMPPKDQVQSVHVADWPQKQNPVASAASSIATAEVPYPSPLARTSVMRENTTTTSSATGETRQEIAAKKVKSDQVVQEAMRMFRAEIKNIQLK